jgi:outer membrane lipoprotein carrier protein
MKVVKVVKSELMGTETRFIGKISISAGLFRWENTEPEKSLIVYDGETIWNEQSPPKEFPGPSQVAKAKLDRKNRSQVMITSLLGGTSVFENFTVLSEKVADKTATYLVSPKTSDLKIKSLEIVILKNEKEVSQISYQDDVGNLTTMDFSRLEFNQKKNDQLFKYTPPKGAQVTTL